MPFTVSVHEQEAFPVITLHDTDSGCEAEIYTFGGLLNSFKIPLANNLINIVDGFNSVADAIKNITNGFKSAKLSPFVCRMYKGNYQFDNKAYHVNKHYLKQHAIHGLVYDGIYSIVNTSADTSQAKATLVYQYQGSDDGYPFTYNITLNWKLEAGNKLTVATTVVHHNIQPIPLADGWHPYFRLGDSIDDCTLQFNSATQLAFDGDLLPTGKTIADTRFINGSSLQDISLDNSYQLDPLVTQPSCVLSNKVLKLTVEPDKSYPILQIYTPIHRKSIAIENLSGAPDNFNNGMGLILLSPNEPKVFTTSYAITAINEY